MAIGCAPCLPGLAQQLGLCSGLHPIWGALYDLSMFVGVGVASVVYCILMRGAPVTVTDVQNQGRGDTEGPGGALPVPAGI